MLRSIMVLVALAIIGFSADQAAARLVRVSWVGEDDLKAKCSDNGGTWSSGATGYSCGKRCAGNDYCVYGCSKGKENNECHASIPRVGPAPDSRLGAAAGVESVLNWAAPADAMPKSGSAARRPGFRAPK